MAEGEGFEPPVPFLAQRFSRPPVSTAHPSLRGSERYTLSLVYRNFGRGDFPCRYTLRTTEDQCWRFQRDLAQKRSLKGYLPSSWIRSTRILHRRWAFSSRLQASRRPLSIIRQHSGFGGRIAVRSLPYMDAGWQQAQPTHSSNKTARRRSEEGFAHCLVPAK
jgi:hypothetical protein